MISIYGIWQRQDLTIVNTYHTRYMNICRLPKLVINRPISSQSVAFNVWRGRRQSDRFGPNRSVFVQLRRPYHSSRLSKRPYIGITVETGNRLVDQFFPSVCEMVDLVANGLEYNRRLHQYVIRQELRTPRALQHVISRLVESLKKMK